MKTMMIATLMVLTATSAQAAVKDCAAASKNTLRLLSSAAEEIQSQTSVDQRIDLNRNSPEYKQLNAIGVVTVPSVKAFGTGFLVDACHVVTNKHVVFGKTGTPKTGAKVAFSAGETGDKNKPFVESMVDGKVIAHGKFDGTVSSENSDWVVVKLSKSIGDKLGYIPLYQMDFKKMVGRPVSTAGFPGSKTQNGKDFSKIYGDLNCKITATSIYGFMFHTCQATPGQSGSPVVSKGNDGKYYAIAMISGDMDSSSLDRSEDPEKANMAVSFDSGKADNVVSEGDKIVQAIKSDKCD
jgi:V8-like Glu-specific endopeptidase